MSERWDSSAGTRLNFGHARFRVMTCNALVEHIISGSPPNPDLHMGAHYFGHVRSSSVLSRFSTEPLTVHLRALARSRVRTFTRCTEAPEQPRSRCPRGILRRLRALGRSNGGDPEVRDDDQVAVGLSHAISVCGDCEPAGRDHDADCI